MSLRQQAAEVLEKHLAESRELLRPALPPLTAKQKHQRPKHYILRNFG
jgi:hypothetical protein